MKGISNAFPFEMNDLRIMVDEDKESLPLYVESLAERPGNLIVIGQEARRLLACTLLLDPNDPEAEQWLRLLCRANTLQAARTISGEGSVTLDMPVLGRTTVPRRPGATNVLSLRTYVDACHAAYALDDPEAAEVLSRVPIEALEANPLDYQLLHARSLQAMLQGDMRKAATIALEALTACNDESRPEDDRRFPMWIVSPEIELMICWGQPAGEWDDRVRTALCLNREHAMWETDGNPGVTSYVVLGALAFAAIRHAAGLPASPRAPELPLGLIYRTYAGLGANPPLQE